MHKNNNVDFARQRRDLLYKLKWEGTRKWQKELQNILKCVVDRGLWNNACSSLDQSALAT